MDIKIIDTADGSHSLYVESLDEIYHSTNGAITESEHVFLQRGFDGVKDSHSQLNILEVGFGTGLNALLTAKASEEIQGHIAYTAIEPYPVKAEIIDQLNYASLIEMNDKGIWERIHNEKWNSWLEIHSHLSLFKMDKKLEILDLLQNHFHLLYFDAFAPTVQPELWTKAIFEKLYRSMKYGGKLLTYSARGEVRRNLQAAGFSVERLPGPPGKREMLRASK